MRRGLVGRNITEFVDLPRAGRHEFRTLSVEEEARRFLDAASGDPFEALYVLALTTGMRQGELLALRWRDVEFTSAHGEGARYTAAGFDNELEIPTPDHVVDPSSTAVTSRRRSTRASSPSTGRTASTPATAWDEQGLVFTNEIGRPVNVSNFCHRSFRPLLGRAGIGASGSTTCATRPQRCCSSRTCTPRWCRRCSGMPTSGSHSICTATSPLRCRPVRRVSSTNCWEETGDEAS